MTLGTPVPALQEAEIERLSELLEDRPQEVIARLESLVKDTPSVSAHFLLARAWSRIDANQSLVWLEKVFEVSPEHDGAWKLWADIMVQSAQYEYAILRLHHQLKRTPRSSYLHLLLAQIYVSTGTLAKAEKEFRQVIEVAPDASENKTQALYSLGYLYVSLGRIEDGEQLLRQALERNNSYLPAMTALSKLLIDMGQSEEAGRLLARARDMKSTDPEVLLLLGRYHLKQKQSKEAVGVLRELLKKAPDYTQVHFFLAQAYQAEGRVDQAKEHFRIFREWKRKKTQARNLDRLRGLAVQGVK